MKVVGKIKMAWFWLVAFSVVVFNTLKGNTWHMVFVNFDFGETPDGRPKRKQLIAKRSCSGAEVYWQDLSKLV